MAEFNPITRKLPNLQPVGSGEIVSDDSMDQGLDALKSSIVSMKMRTGSIVEVLRKSNREERKDLDRINALRERLNNTIALIGANRVGSGVSGLVKDPGWVALAPEINPVALSLLGGLGDPKNQMKIDSLQNVRRKRITSKPPKIPKRKIIKKTKIPRWRKILDWVKRFFDKKRGPSNNIRKFSRKSTKSDTKTSDRFKWLKDIKWQNLLKVGGSIGFVYETSHASSYRPELQEGIEGERARDRKKWDFLLSSMRWDSDKNKSTTIEGGNFLKSYDKFEKEELQNLSKTVPEIKQLEEEKSKLNPIFNYMGWSERAFKIQELKKSYIPQIRKKFIEQNPEIIPRLKGTKWEVISPVESNQSSSLTSPSSVDVASLNIDVDTTRDLHVITILEGTVT